MKAFKFPLEKVLSWRHLQMRAEEEKLALLQRYLENLNQKANALAAAEMNSRLRLLSMESLQGADLHALAPFQERVKKERAALSAEKAQCEKRIAMQRVRLLKARKNFRVLEKLKERRLEAWQYENNRELENFAAEAHIAKLLRGDS